MHQIIECASDISAAIKSADGVEPTFMRTSEKEAALVALVEARSQLEALTLRVLASADDVADTHGLAQAADWVAMQTRVTRREARADQALARGLEQHPSIAAALGRGGIRSAQARAIVEAIDHLPATVATATRDEARSVLLGLAADHDARDLKRLGKRILDVIAPEVGEANEAAALEAEESRADATASWTMTDDGEGRCHGRFTLPSHIGKILRRQLLALANPARHCDDELKDDHGKWKPLSRRLGEALVDYVERYPVDRTPMTAGVNATVVITMTLEQLLGEHRTALLDDGSRMSAGQARRLACEAGIVPVVLGTASQPLDLGRAARLFTKAQRIALGLRDGGCTARSCETSASGCHAHHDDPWSRAGRTDLLNGRLLCPRHHRLAHDPRYAMTVHADNKVTFARRT